MKLSLTLSAFGLALIFSPTCLGTATHRFHHLHEKKHTHLHPARRQATSSVLKRDGQCQFPADDTLVAITPHEKNGGWAMSPDQECLPGSYCPIACKPGMVMAQWDPRSRYEYPSSMNGGLYCDNDGNIQKPFSSKPYCVDGTGTVEAVNRCGQKMSWCQTVLPGNEAMLIPTLVESVTTIAVPDSSYWGQTAAHFYVNPPGVGVEGCIWGDDGSAIGNWSPYVAGANTNADGSTFLTVGWNPVWEASGLNGQIPEYGLEIKCPDGGCTGLPCKIDPSEGSGEVESNTAGTGAGNSRFCVVTLSRGKKAQIVAFSLGSVSSPSSDEEEEEAEEETPTTVEPAPHVETTSEAARTTTSADSTSSSIEAEPTMETTSSEPTSEELSSTVPISTFTPSTPSFSPRPGIFHENATASATDLDEPTSSLSDAAPTSSDDQEGEAGRRRGNAAVAGLVVAVIAATCLF